MSRIEEARRLELPCERPADFDLAEYWESSTRLFLEGRPRYEATLRLEPRAAEDMKMWRLASPVPAEGGDDPEGWITLRVQFEDEGQACFVVLGLGRRADVIDPKPLRDRVAADAAAIIERARAR